MNRRFSCTKKFLISELGVRSACHPLLDAFNRPNHIEVFVYTAFGF